MTLDEKLREDRRGIMLRALDEAAGGRLSEHLVKQVIDLHGQLVSGDQVRGDLDWLAQQGLLRIERLETPAGTLWVATLLATGQDVARGVPHHGVRRQAPQR